MYLVKWTIQNYNKSFYVFKHQQLYICSRNKAFPVPECSKLQDKDVQLQCAHGQIGQCLGQVINLTQHRSIQVPEHPVQRHQKLPTILVIVTLQAQSDHHFSQSISRWSHSKPWRPFQSGRRLLYNTVSAWKISTNKKPILSSIIYAQQRRDNSIAQQSFIFKTIRNNPLVIVKHQYWMQKASSGAVWIWIT